MVLFHDDIGHRSQKVRIVIAEKGITCNLEVLSKDDLPKEILEINPDGHLPLLVDRELSLYHSGQSDIKRVLYLPKEVNVHQDLSLKFLLEDRPY